MNATGFFSGLLVLLTASAYAQDGWVMQSSPLDTTSLGKLQFVSPTEGWIAAENGQLLHTTNAGANWAVVTPSTNDTVEVLTEPPFSMSFADSSTGYLIGTLGGFTDPRGAVLYKTTNSGSTWNRQILSGSVFGLAVQFVDAGNGWAVTGSATLDLTLLRTTDAGSTWPAVHTVNGKLLFPQFVDANNGWAVQLALSGGGPGPPSEILHTKNAGAAWSTQLTDSAASLTALQFLNRTEGWVGGDDSTLLHTTNSGADWVPVTNTGVQFEVTSLFFLDSNTGWIGSRTPAGTAFVLHTTNGGASWSVQDVPQLHAITSLHFVDANTGWGTSNDGKIIHTITGGVTAAEEGYDAAIPGGFHLEQNYPNPFNPSTTIAYDLPTSSDVTLTVFDMLGREVQSLVNETQAAGSYKVEFAPTGLASGLYLYRITAGRFVQTRKLVLLR